MIFYTLTHWGRVTYKVTLFCGTKLSKYIYIYMIAIRVKKLWLHDTQSLPRYIPFARESNSDPKSPEKDPVINNVDIVFVIGWKVWTSIAGMTLPSDVPVMWCIRKPLSEPMLEYY